MLTTCCPRCHSHSTSEVVSITAFRVWIRCDVCGYAWREKPAAYLLRRGIGLLAGRLARGSRFDDVARSAEAVVAEPPERGLAPTYVTRTLVPADLRRGVIPSQPRSVDDLEQWFDRCEQDLGPTAPVFDSVADWLEADPFETPVEQPARRDQGWAVPPRPPELATAAEVDRRHDGSLDSANVSGPVAAWLESDPFDTRATEPTRRDERPVAAPPAEPGTFGDRLDALYDGLVRLEAFVLRCTRDEEAKAKCIEPPRAEQQKPDAAHNGNVLEWRPRERGRRQRRRTAGEKTRHTSA